MNCPFSRGAYRPGYRCTRECHGNECKWTDELLTAIELRGPKGPAPAPRVDPETGELFE